ncbi:hypothetical protein [Bradyrhizobium genomosp. III]|uniref:hypothetical protein n=1 Tax=Bradyrhizobium genomosp. III TaxID=2683271 RepID=UPI0012F507E1|nr:hypothetical protein [Bradyrhizobium sp. CCBAU 15615]
MSVLMVKGQTNASVVLKGLLQQHGLPDLTAEGVDALSAKFETGIVIGHGVVSFEGKPLIDALRALHADAEAGKRFFASSQGSQDHDPAGNLTGRYRAEVAASRKQARITDADLARYTGITRQHIEHRQRAAREQ